MNPPHLSARPPRRRVWLALATLILAGCASFKPEDAVVGPDFVPANVYRAASRLDPAMRNLAVLPLATDPEIADSDDGKTALEPVLRTQLARQQKFELTTVSPQQLREWTGRANWTAEEELPPDFFVNLRQKLHCDGVLFCRLTHFQPYPPLVLGWRLKLVDVESCQVIWAVDEVFDAREKPVANSARRYQQASQSFGSVSPDSQVILTSPGRFASYSIEAALKTLPDR
jgi:hypothetical protein